MGWCNGVFLKSLILRICEPLEMIGKLWGNGKQFSFLSEESRMPLQDSFSELSPIWWGDYLARLGHVSALEMGCHGEQRKVQRAMSLRRQKDSFYFFHVHFELVLTSASKMSRRKLKV